MRNHYITIGTILGLGLLGVILILLTIPARSAPGATATPVPDQGENLHGSSIDGQIIFSRQGFLWSWRGDKATRLPVEPGASTIQGNAVQLIQPSLSQDGTKLAFIRQDETFSDLWVANSDGTNARNITNYRGDGTPRSPDFTGSSLWAFSPTWSPNGTEVAFLSDVGTDDLALWATSASKFDRRVISKLGVGQGGLLRPSYAPQANEFVVAAYENGKSQIYDLKPNSDSATKLTDQPDGAYDPTLSPDGNFIAYIARKGNFSELWLMRADGSQPVLLTNQASRYPAWSPDSKKLAFLALKDGAFEIFTIKLKADGTPDGGPQQLSANAKLDGADGITWGR
jgi:TolB protein